MTLASIARQAGVHASTVSRVLNPATRGMVSDAVVRRVDAVAAHLGYRPNAVAASLRRGRSMTVGVVLPDITNPVFPPILSGIEAALDPEGYIAMVANAGDDPARQALILERLAARQVDGIILATAARHGTVLPRLGTMPVVLVNRTDSGGTLPSVVSDDMSGMALAVAHLAGLGHVRIGHVGGPERLSTGHGRAQGFLRAMAGLGLRPAGLVHAAAYRVRRGRGLACGCSVAPPSPPSSRQMTCWPWGAWMSWPCGSAPAQARSRSLATTTCRSWTWSARP